MGGSAAERRSAWQLEGELRQALETRNESGVHRTIEELRNRDPGSRWLRRAEGWLAVRGRWRRRERRARWQLAAALYAADVAAVVAGVEALSAIPRLSAAAAEDLSLAEGWLQEETERRRQRCEAKRRRRLRLWLTAAPLLLATALSTVIAIVLLAGV